MGRFADQFKSEQIDQFKGKYFSYDELKETLNNNKTNNINESLQEFISTFKEDLDKQLKKIYICFIQNERKLYVAINSHLHIRQNYDTFSIRQISKELDDLKHTAQYTYNIINYISINLNALKNLLRLFDKAFKSIYGELSTLYITNKINTVGSDLAYILRFKIIDEASTIVEDLIEELRDRTIELRKNNFKKLTNTLNDDDILDTQLILPMNSVDSSNEEDTTTDKNEIVKQNIHLIEDISIILKNIDDIIRTFKITFKEWTSISNKKPTDSGSKNNTKMKYAGSSSSLTSLPLFSIGDTAISDDNKRNINILSLLNFFISIFEIVVYSNAIDVLNDSIGFNGIIIALHYFTEMISSLYTKRMIGSSYKKPIIVNSIIALLSIILYIIGVRNTNGLLFIIISRAIFGFGMNRGLYKNYIINFTPKKMIKNYVVRSKIINYVGNIFGILIQIGIYIFYRGNDDSNIINYHTISCIVSFFGIIISLALVVLKFNEPLANINQSDIQSQGMLLNRNSSSFDENEGKQSINDANSINEQMGQLNDASKFSDTNLVAKSIEQISWKEKMISSSFLYKSFTVIQIINFLAHYSFYLLFCFISVFFNQNYLNNSSMTHLFVSGSTSIIVSIILVLLSYLIFIRFIASKMQDVTVILVTLLFLILLHIGLFILSRNSQTKKFLIIMFVCMILLYNIIINSIKHMFTKIIPYEFIIKETIRAETAFKACISIGTVLGSLTLVLLFVKSITLTTLIGPILGIIAIILLIIILITRRLMKDKPIVRLLRAQAQRKFKMEEF